MLRRCLGCQSHRVRSHPAPILAAERVPADAHEGHRRLYLEPLYPPVAVGDEPGAEEGAQVAVNRCQALPIGKHLGKIGRQPGQKLQGSAHVLDRIRLLTLFGQEHSQLFMGLCQLEAIFRYRGKIGC